MQQDRCVLFTGKHDARTTRLSLVGSSVCQISRSVSASSNVKSRGLVFNLLISFSFCPKFIPHFYDQYSTVKTILQLILVADIFEVTPIRKSNDTLFYLLGAIPVVWLALLLAQSLGSGLPELLQNLTRALEHPADTARSPRLGYA